MASERIADEHPQYVVHMPPALPHPAAARRGIVQGVCSGQRAVPRLPATMAASSLFHPSSVPPLPPGRGQAALADADKAAGADDRVIEQGDVEQRAGCDDLPGHEHILG